MAGPSADILSHKDKAPAADNGALKGEPCRGRRAALEGRSVVHAACALVGPTYRQDVPAWPRSVGHSQRCFHHGKMKDHFEMTCIHTQPVSPGRHSGQAEGRLSGGPVAVTAPRLAHREYRTCSHLSKHLLAKLPGPSGPHTAQPRFPRTPAQEASRVTRLLPPHAHGSAQMAGQGLCPGPCLSSRLLPHHIPQAAGATGACGSYGFYIPLCSQMHWG
ncbi:uncharacterized protein LOC130682714 [Manis pentadactyla]|uniref:uncharacterized protein LOC130682714 n=1 Tax=Manis pentadactyla TaxID=143292 RepID=UPI00255C6066|nr:uncharacterized protein LOC130682714 [Manis pentadactyla]